jgi:hypothetical protein
MTAKTLTDELRSVLLFHALEAPEPGPTVDRILADTVGQVTALDLHGEAPVSSTKQGRSRWLSVQQLLVAGVVAVLLLSVAGINSVRNRNAAQTATQAAQDRADERQVSSEAVDGSFVEAPGADSALTGPRPANPPAYAGTRLNCSTITGGRLMTGQVDDYQLSSEDKGYLYEWLCVGPDGQRSASEVQMFRLVEGDLRYVKTLARPTADEHLVFLTAGGGTVVMQVSDNSSQPGRIPGEVRSLAWQLADPRGGTSRGATVAEPCRREDLAVTVTAVPDPVAPSWRLSVRNKSEESRPASPEPGSTDRLQSSACALEGFPQVRAERDGVTLGTAAPAMRGPAGGVTKQKVPPIIVLTPGATASAVIEQSARSAAGSCLRSDQLVVTLPNGVFLGSVPAEVAGCGLVVHPLVGNARGSD